jgi:hypothetical protein
VQAQGQRAFVSKTAVKKPVANSTTNETQTLPIKRVILYSNGVAYIERRGTVNGHAEINLSFKQSQVDDVLKSMVVLDLGQGRIGAVSYNSSAPPSSRMADIPFSISSQTNTDGGGLAGVLAQLQGARVVVTTTQGVATGSVLTIEKKLKSEKDKPTITTHSLVIASESGELSSFDLSDVRSIKLLEEGTKRDIVEFANATASARRRDAKTITVTSDGNASREMVISYTIAAPIWKTTYRVVLDEQGKPFFQGWAIVDNVSEEDWSGVSLSLVSGTPISFIQSIQQPFYRYRPVVPMPSDLKLDPQVYEPNEEVGQGVSSGANALTGVVTDPNGAVILGASVEIRNNSTGQTYNVATSSDGTFRTGTLSSGNYTVTVSASGFQRLTVRDVSVGMGRPNNLNLSLNVGSVSATVEITGSQVQQLPLQGRGFSNLASLSPGTASNYIGGAQPTTSISDAMTSNKSGVETAATGDEVGDLFEYKVNQPVTVKRDRSALIPIVQTKMEGERISIYNPTVRVDRPMSGMLLKNTTTLTLEGGSMTVLDRDAYAGEALMDRLKPAEQRLISFALDLGTLVTAKQEASNAPVFLVRAVNGVFQTHYYQTDKRVYTLRNQTDRERVIFIEHPVRQDWVLSDDKDAVKPFFTTSRYYRFRVVLKPFDKIELPVIERRALMNTYQLSNFTRTDLDLFVSQRFIDDETRKVLEKITDIKTRINTIDVKIQSLENEEESISNDQDRLRENIKALNSTPEAKQLIARYVSKANDQETRLEQIEKESKTANADREKLYQELNSLIKGIDVEKRL